MEPEGECVTIVTLKGKLLGYLRYYHVCHFNTISTITVINITVVVSQGSDSQASVSDVSCSETASSFPSAVQGSAPEILLGLVYNATTGRLSVEVIKGSHFKNVAANKPPSE